VVYITTENSEISYQPVSDQDPGNTHQLLPNQFSIQGSTTPENIWTGNEMYGIMWVSQLLAEE
jgi:hypothetical protein